MRRISIRLLILLTLTVSAEWLQAQMPNAAPNTDHRIPRGPRKPGLPKLPARHTGPSILPASAAPDVVSVQCPPQAAALGAVCGYVNVPLDRKRPEQETITINFELYVHSGPTLESAILVNFGGPGSGTTTLRNEALNLYASNLDAHDLLLIDDRGRGLSGAIECEELQHGTAPWNQAMADCAAQLGNAASRYGTGDIAQDMEAVRAALGYALVDYFGASYGGADVTAYVTRFGEHLRSIVIDAPFGTPDLNESRFVSEQFRTNAEPRMVRLDCERSPNCSRDHPLPDAEFDTLVSRIQSSPVEGDSYDANGNLVHVRIDEDALLNFVDNPTGNFTSTGELLAAASSLSQGDSRPLLRLGAENFFLLESDFGDPTVFSAGAAFATACVDMDEPWAWPAPVPERVKQEAHAISKLPILYFGPFSTEAGTGILFDFFGTRCLNWEKPTQSSPVTEHHAVYPSVPTLALTGDLDTRVPFEEVSEVAALFPNSALVSVAEAGHTSVQWSPCAANLASHFIETLQVGDITCTRTPGTVWPAVGRFPLFAKFALPADVNPNGQNEIGLDERKVVTVAVATAIDAMQRSIIGFGNGVGLRAGTFHTDYGPIAFTTTLTNCEFAEDVMVNGTATWDYVGSFVADLSVSGSGTGGGTLHIQGTWQAPGSVGNFNVSGTLGGKQVALLVPEA